MTTCDACGTGQHRECAGGDCLCKINMPGLHEHSPEPAPRRRGVRELISDAESQAATDVAIIAGLLATIALVIFADLPPGVSPLIGLAITFLSAIGGALRSVFRDSRAARRRRAAR